MDVILLAPLVTKLVDLVRKADPNNAWPKAVWIVLALVIGVLVVWFDPLAASHRDFEDILVDGLKAGALSSGFHELFDALSGTAKGLRARVYTAQQV